MSATRITRHWRHALLGCLFTAILFLSITDDPYISTWRPSTANTDRVERVGLEAFLEETTEMLDFGETIGKLPYDVPADFGQGTKANFTASLFPRITIGNAFQPIPLPKSRITTRPGDPPVEEMTGETFNPAILKMPRGMAKGWEYIVMARGPRVQRGDLWVSVAGRFAEEHGLVAFPATLTTEGFIPSPVSPAKFLPIKTHMNNTSCGYWAFPFGPEDPRLYWTDDRKPAMSLSMNARRERCRSVGFVEDLRDVWEELGDAMSGVEEGLAKPWVKKQGMEWQGVKELLHDGMGNLEKNWMGLFPGASPNRSITLPTYHYSLVPARIVHPPLDPQESISLIYTLDIPTHPRSNCVADKLRTEVPNTHFIHHATPLYRFTLCGRRDSGCVPEVGNTVMVGVGQVKVVHAAGQRYRRFFVLWNVTEPFEYLAVGPLIRWHDTPDAEIVYAMSLVFTPPSSPPPTRHAARIDAARERLLGPTHGFLDDEVFVSLGLRDNEMGTVRMEAREMLYRMSVC